MQKIANRNGSEYTSKLVEFKGNNTFSEWKKEGCYVVYSYGYHFPMYVYKRGEWYENSDKYSVSTSKQQTQLRPYCTDGRTFKLRNTNELKDMIRA